MFTRELILKLAYWTPLIALLVSSLGLIALKRLSGRAPWARRLAAPPFYFISLPIATLLATTELLVWMVDSFENMFHWRKESWLLRLVGDLSDVWLAVRQAPFEMFGLGIFVIVLLVAMAASCQVLKWALSHQDWSTNPPAKVRNRVKTAFPLFVFVWTWTSVSYVVVDLDGGPFFLTSVFFP
jgi:hypothetical protein